MQLTSHMDNYSAAVVDVLLVNIAPFLNYQLPDRVLWPESPAPITPHQMTTVEKEKSYHQSWILHKISNWEHFSPWNIFYYLQEKNIINPVTTYTVFKPSYSCNSELNIPHHFSLKIALVLQDPLGLSISQVTWSVFLCHLDWLSSHLWLNWSLLSWYWGHH